MTWVHSRAFDFSFILSPPLFVLIIFLLFPGLTAEHATLDTVSWVFIVLAIDVSHVYGTLWRTYWHREKYLENRSKLLMIPVMVWVCGVVLYTFSVKIFWSVLAYVAVFHFMRQQYGFMRQYSRGEDQSPLGQKLDSLLIHALCLYPIIYWHAHLPRNFNWMIEGDFLVGTPVVLEKISFILYTGLIATYIVKEIRRRVFNLPKNLLILTTGLTWYFGMVYFNGDVAFTVTNVVAHGIPYMALVWVHERKDFSRFRSWWGPVLFFGIALLLAYGEEALWAGLVWREHLNAFEFMRSYAQLNDEYLLAVIVPLLTLPQATHYVLDGIIWKRDYMELGSARIKQGGK